MLFFYNVTNMIIKTIIILLIMKVMPEQQKSDDVVEVHISHKAKEKK